MQKMLCDAFLFKNVICVINSRMCLALECLTVFLLSLFHWREKKKSSKRLKWALICLMRVFFLRERKGKQKIILIDHLSSFWEAVGCVCVRARVCVYFMVSVR